MSDCELPAYYVCSEPVARKKHGCCECSAPIQIGEKHLCVSACYEGNPERFRQHFLCAEACMLVRDAGLNDDECLMFGGLFEFWLEKDNFSYDPLNIEAGRKLWRFMLRIKRRERTGK